MDFKSWDEMLMDAFDGDYLPEKEETEQIILLDLNPKNTEVTE